jgi:hypothetical protein
MREWYIVERRRVVADAIHLRQVNGHGGMHAVAIAQANQGIAAIEEAIEHEKRLSTPTAASMIA